MAPPVGLKQSLFAALEDEFVVETKTSKETIPQIKQTNTEIPVMPLQSKSGGGFKRFLTAADIVLFVVNAMVTIYVYNKFNTLNLAYADFQKDKTKAHFAYEYLVCQYL